MDYKPKCGNYERFVPSAFVVFKTGLPSEKKKKANILTLKSKLAASEGNEDGERGMSLSRFFLLHILITF